MKVVLFNWFHAGDVILSRAILSDVMPLLREHGHDVELRCKAERAYLWSDLGAPISSSQDLSSPAIDLWFGRFPDVLSRAGLTHANQIETWNRQAMAAGLPILPAPQPRPYVDLPPPAAPPPDLGRCVLVENGAVLSGQPCYDVPGAEIARMATENDGWAFACSAPPRVSHPGVVDCSAMNLLSLSAVARSASVIVSRLSGITVASLTSENRGKPRLVAGIPMSFPIWNDEDMRYFPRPEDLRIGVRRALWAAGAA